MGTQLKILRPGRPWSAVGWFLALACHYPSWYTSSPRGEVNPGPWPPGFDPEHDSVFAHNEIQVPGVPADRIFQLLVRAADWPKYYPNSADVQIEPKNDEPGESVGRDRKNKTDSSGELTPGTRFRWKTFASEQQSEVILYERDRALGWTAQSLGTQAFHRWLLVAQGSGTRVITEECQTGPVAWLDQSFMNPALHATHQLWLENLRTVALKRLP